VSIQSLIKQTEDLVFQIGQQASYKDLHVSALSLLKEMYSVEQRQPHNANEESKSENGYKAINEEMLAQIQKAERKLMKWANDPDSMPSKILDVYGRLKQIHPKSVIDKALMARTFEQLNEDTYTFSQNFDQMKNFSDKNHAKIFDVAPNGNITIWSPIERFYEAYLDTMYQRIDTKQLKRRNN